MSIENITQQIVEDVQDALATITQSIEHPQAAISNVNVRVGQKSTLIDGVDDLDSNLFSPKNGWVIDIEFVPELLKPSEHTFKTIPTYPVFKNLSIEALKGLGPTWEKRFNERSIHHIEDLVGLPTTMILDWSQEFDSLAPIEFRRKAEMLKRRIPLSLVNQALERNLAEWVYSDFSFSEIPEADLTKEVELMNRFFEACVAAIDIDALREISMHQFI